jgi:hypothetical protein
MYVGMGQHKNQSRSSSQNRRAAAGRNRAEETSPSSLLIQDSITPGDLARNLVKLAGISRTQSTFAPHFLPEVQTLLIRIARLPINRFS